MVVLVIVDHQHQSVVIFKTVKNLGVHSDYTETIVSGCFIRVLDEIEGWFYIILLQIIGIKVIILFEEP